MTDYMNIATISQSWKEIYNRVKENTDFKIIANTYYSFIFEEPYPNYNDTPINFEYKDKEDNVEAKSPEEAKWWISPNNAPLVNGLFLYHTLKLIGITTDIYESDMHTFLKDDKDIIYDLYWQPLGYNKELHMNVYKSGKKMELETFMKMYDMDVYFSTKLNLYV